jgi:hypothetical protein
LDSGSSIGRATRSDRVWDAFQRVPRELRFLTRGDTGIVSGFATFRGKPKDAGFRQRFVGFTHAPRINPAIGMLTFWMLSPEITLRGAVGARAKYSQVTRKIA